MRERLEDVREENRFLRAQLEVSRSAEEQMRILLMQTMRALDAATAPPALEASAAFTASPASPPEPAPRPRRAWWAFWRWATAAAG